MKKNPVRILIVEDERPLLKLLVKKVEDEGWEASTALDGVEAARKISTERPTLVLLDLLLPKRDGISVLKEMRERKETADIPVVVLTNLSTGESVSAVLDAGGTDYLVKTDYTLDDVITKIRQRLPKERK